MDWLKRSPVATVLTVVLLLLALLYPPWLETTTGHRNAIGTSWLLTPPETSWSGVQIDVTRLAVHVLAALVAGVLAMLTEAGIRAGRFRQAAIHVDRCKVAVGDWFFKWDRVIIVVGLVVLAALLVVLATLSWLTVYSSYTHNSMWTAATTLPPKADWDDALIISYGASISIPASEFLAGAAARNNRRDISLRLSEGADPDGAHGQTHWAPLHWAAWKGNADAIAALLDGGAHIERGDRNGMSALHIAAMYGHITAATRLLDRSANVDSRNRWGGTPLHTATMNNQHQMVMLLLDRGANIEATDKYGCTPLIHGPHAPAATEALLSRGANPRVRTRAGETALQQATRLDMQATMNVLRRHGVKE